MRLHVNIGESAPSDVNSASFLFFAFTISTESKLVNHAIVQLEPEQPWDVVGADDALSKTISRDDAKSNRCRMSGVDAQLCQSSMAFLECSRASVCRDVA